MKTSFINESKFHLNYLFKDDQFFILTFDFMNNLILLNEYKCINSNFVHTVRPLKTKFDLKQIDYCCLTHKSNYLFIVQAHSVSYLDINTLNIIAELSVDRSDFQLSNRIEPVENTDDFILLVTKPQKQSLVVSYLELNFSENKYQINRFESQNERNVLYMKLNKTYLCFVDYIFNMNEMSTQTEMKIFDLVKVKHHKSFFKQQLFEIELKKHLNDYCLSDDNEYLYLVETLNLCVFRIRDNLKILNVPISQSVSQIWAHEKHFVNLILANGELISLVLIDAVNVQVSLEQYESIKKIR